MKYVNDGIINQILSIDENKTANEIESFPKPLSKIIEQKDIKNDQQQDLNRNLNDVNFDLNIQTTKLNLNSKFENEKKEIENKTVMLGLYNNEEFSINNQSNF